MTRWSLVLVGVAAVSCSGACSCTRAPPPSADPPAVTSSEPPRPVPPVAPSGVAPLSAFLDAAPAEGAGTPFEQAAAYEANGQYWLARLAVEKKALSETGTKPEIELLARVCHAQEDVDCVAACEKRLGRRLKFDGGAPRASAGRDAGEHREPATDAARARDLVLKRKAKEARAILEPKVIDGRASPEEIRLLRGICKDEGDRMCVALCDAKLP